MGKTYLIKYDDPNMTVGELKSKFESQSNIPVDAFRLVLRGGIVLTELD
jgi:hypothetical protein